LLDMIFAGERRQDEGERSPAAPTVSWDQNLPRKRPGGALRAFPRRDTRLRDRQP
jgi:hypothetical protein